MSTDLLDNEDLLESRIEDFVKLRQSQAIERRSKLEQSMGLGNEVSKKSANMISTDFFEIHKKEDDYFLKMSEHEQMLLYTNLHDQNHKLREHIDELKKELIPILQKVDGLAGMDMKSLQRENQDLRERLRQLTYKKETPTGLGSLTQPKKKLLKVYGNNKTTTAPKEVIFSDRQQIQNKIDELKSDYQMVERQLKETHDILQRLNIKVGSQVNEPTHRTFDVPEGKNPKEMRNLIAGLQARFEALRVEAEQLEAQNRAVELAVTSKTDQFKRQIDDNAQRENNYIELRTNDPFEIKREIEETKAREIEMTGRIRTLQNLPIFKNNSEANVLMKFEESKRIIQDLKVQNEVQTKKTGSIEVEIEMMKKLQHELKETILLKKRDTTRAKAMYEASLQKQNNDFLNRIDPMKVANQTSQQQSMYSPDMYNEKFIRTLGLVKWKGEEPAWYRLQFLENTRKLNPKDPNSIVEEYRRLIKNKSELADRLGKVEAILKTTVEEEKRKEDEHLLLKKKREYDLLQAEEQRKDLENTIDRIASQTGKVFVGRNQRTGEEVYYNDAVSVFSADKSDLFKIGIEENLLDLYIDRFDLDGQGTATSLEDVNCNDATSGALVTMVAVNFFNHPTLTSQKCFGLKGNVNMQCTFAFRVDAFFIEYCRSNTLDLDLFYSNEHGYQVKFAVGKIEMNDLIEANLKDKRADYIGVVNKFARVLSLGGQNIGVISFRMRPRLPIYRELLNLTQGRTQISDVPKTAFDVKFLDQARRLHIRICNGYGFSTYSKVFVTYRFMDKPEVVTQEVEGASPRFDHQRTFDIQYTKSIREYFRTEKVEFLAFDDSIPFKQQEPLVDAAGIKLRDLVGSAHVSLVPLTYGKPIVEKVYFMNASGKVGGSMFIKVFFDDMNLQDRDFNQGARDKKWEDNLNRLVINQIRAKKLTLRSTFNIADQDNSKELSKKEFQKVLRDILGIELSEPEMDDYWRRITSNSSKDDVTFGQLLTFYGYLLDIDVLGRNSFHQDLKDVKSLFNNNSINDLDPHSETSIASRLLQTYSNEVKRVMKERKLNEKQIFDIYDKDKNLTISRSEFTRVSDNDLNIRMELSDLNAIFDFIAKDRKYSSRSPTSRGESNQDDKIDISELFKAIHFNMDEFIKSQSKLRDPENPENWPTERILLNFLQEIKKFMNEKGLSVFQVFAMMDKSKDSVITRKEIRDFIKIKLGFKMLPAHEEVVLNAIDKGDDGTGTDKKSGDGKVTVKEFMNFLKLEESLKILNDKNAVEEMKDLVVMKVLFTYMIERDKTPAEIALDIDQDQSGTVEIYELGSYISRISNQVSPLDLEKFLIFVDRDMSKSVKLEELVNALVAYESHINSETQISPEKYEELLKKLIPLINKNKESIKKSIESDVQGEEGLIHEAALKKALQNTGIFDPVDLELIINPICRRFSVYKPQGRMIRANSLFDLKTLYKQYLQLKESGFMHKKGHELVEKLFKAMKKVMIKYNLSVSAFFQFFDIKPDGFMTQNELRRNIADMNIDLTNDQYADIMSQLDRNGDGKISLTEFDEYLRKVEV